MLDSNRSNTVQITDNISGKDFNGYEFVIMNMYCNIIANKSINFTYDILMPDAYNNNIDEIKVKVADFKAECEKQAANYGVTIF
jgi:hypothetical protein